MCVSSPEYPVIIGNVRCARQTLPDPNWKAEDHREARTSGGNNNDNDNQGGDMNSWMFKEESNRGKTKNRDSAQIKKYDNHCTQDVNFKCPRRHHRRKVIPVLTRAQAKKSDKFQPLKVKEAMSSVDKSTIEDLQKNGSTLKKCFGRVGKLIIRENFVAEFFIRSGLFYRKHRDEDGKKFKPVSCT